ncbi:MAG TPA: Uma2 family endonuclease [Pyrinomonadaceae bacterium]|nr:Uma2 family endonuclease [Pyrinomonadaceae bacterium]
MQRGKINMVTAEITFSREQLLGLNHPIEWVGVNWQTYEDISEELGESTSFHLTYNKGVLTIMPVTELHETLIILLERFITLVSLVTQKNIIPTGKATLRSKRRDYGVEPDLSYFVSKSDIHQLKNYVPKELELAPDIVGEIDIHHPSDDKFEIYAEFGVSEFWQYNGERFKIFKLQSNSEYAEIERSEEIPILTSAVLTEFLKRGQTEQQFTVLSDFQNWLNAETRA